MPSAAGGCEFIDIYVFIRYFFLLHVAYVSLWEWQKKPGRK